MSFSQIGKKRKRYNNIECLGDEGDKGKSQEIEGTDHLAPIFSRKKASSSSESEKMGSG